MLHLAGKASNRRRPVTSALGVAFTRDNAAFSTHCAAMPDTSTPAPAPKLTALEERALAAVLVGLEPHCIAKQLGISITVTRMLLASLRHKHGVASRAELIALFNDSRTIHDIEPLSQYKYSE